MCVRTCVWPLLCWRAYWLQCFIGGADESWFRLVHVEIEALAARAVAGAPALQQAAAQVRGEGGGVPHGTAGRLRNILVLTTRAKRLQAQLP